LSEIFISYASEDRQRISPLAHAFEARGWSVFWDPKIPTGKSWRDVLGHALKEARCVVVAWSDHSIVSRWVHEEAEEGRDRAILIPVFIDKVSPPLGFRSVQAADLSEWDHTKHSDVFEGLLADIDALLGSFHDKTSEADQASKVAVEGGADALPLPDKPSIAVLPFNNLSGEPDQEYFTDGITEDIITGLTRFHSLFVIARNSTFSYKDQSPDVREVARDLGTRYVVEGSVRRSGERIRITAQLIDAETGKHLWAERYDRKLEDIFEIQDEVTEAIVAAIAPEISDVERERAQRKPPDTLDAWDLYQRGLAVYHSATGEGLKSAIEQFDRVNEIDPTFAPAFAMTAEARWRYVIHFEPEDREEQLNQALEKSRAAITLDPRDPMCLRVNGRVHSILGQHDVAISQLEEAIALNPNDAMSHFFLGANLCSAGRAEEAIPHMDHAMQLSPRDIWLTGMLTHRAFCLFDLGRYEEAFEWVRRASLQPNPRSMTFALLTAVLTKLGRSEEAQAALNGLLTHAPGMSCAKYRNNAFGAPEVMVRFADALREAGLPE